MEPLQFCTKKSQFEDAYQPYLEEHIWDCYYKNQWYPRILGQKAHQTPDFNFETIKIVNSVLLLDYWKIYNTTPILI